MIKDGIMEITQEVADQILQSDNGNGKYKPLGTFWLKGNDVYIGFDNRHGDCWVEEFNTKRACIKWLKGE